MFTLKDILRIQVAPALGCTEPAAVALCAAATKLILKNETIDSVEVIVDPNIYKNGMGVAIPGTNGAYGIELAAALGIVCGDPFLKLEVLEPVTENAVAAAKKMVHDRRIRLTLDQSTRHLYIRCAITSGKTTAEAVIEFVHDNLVSLKLNGTAIEQHPLLSNITNEKSELNRLEAWLKERSFNDLVDLLDTMDSADIAFIKEGLDFNLKLSNYGLLHGTGLGIGKMLDQLATEGLLKKDMVLWAKILTASASDARMSGVKLPAMSSAGSGNHGLTVMLPIWAVKDYIAVDDINSIYRAIALSHLVTAYIKVFTGRLSAVCGCSVAAGAGAAAGIALLMGGNRAQIAGAVKNLIEDLAGVICDGAKNSCSLKLATAAGSAVQSALFSLHGINVKESDGIIAKSTEQTLKNMGKLSVEGMVETDRTILQIMMDKQFTVKKKTKKSDR